MRGEEQRDAIDQFHAIDARRHGAIGGHDRQQQQRLAGGRVAFHLRSSLAEDQRLPHRFEDVVKGQQREDVCRQQERTCSLARAHIRDQRQRSVQPAAVALH